MRKEFAVSVSIYFIVALAVMLAAHLSNGDVGPPTLLALVLLLSLYLWERDYAKKVELSKVD
ncbi:MAG: hypothetical protein QXG58_03085 [Candidatus Bathyarchaeia archaeon]